MKIGVVKRLYTRVLRRRNKACREDKTYPCGSLRLDGEIRALDWVLDDLDRLMKSNHDRFHDRKRK